MSDLTHQRCLNHMTREAVARCPECSRFFCRECITEHEDKVLCASCLRKRLKGSGQTSRGRQWLYNWAQFLSGLVLIYIVFYYFAQVLLALPTAFHEGTIWQSGWWWQR